MEHLPNVCPFGQNDVNSSSFRAYTSQVLCYWLMFELYSKQDISSVDAGCLIMPQVCNFHH